MDITTVTYVAMADELTNPELYRHLLMGTSSMTTFVEPLIEYLVPREFVAVLMGPSEFEELVIKPFQDAVAKTNGSLHMIVGMADLVDHDAQEMLSHGYMNLAFEPFS
jgi:hypothetical protein